jgi:hypothetical protein
MVYDDGQLIEIEKHEVDSVKLDMNEPAASEPTADPAPVAATPVAATTSAGGCTGDTQCSYPRKCVEGICKAPEQYLVALKAESEQRLNAGKWTMVAGAGVAAVGLVIMAVGFGHAAVLRKERDSRNCGFSTDQTGCNELRDKISDYEFAGWLSLYAVIPAAAIVVMAGGITYAVGKNKQRRWEQNRHVQMTPWFGPREVGMTLRF